MWRPVAAPRSPSGFVIDDATLAGSGRWTIQLQVERDDSIRTALFTEVAIQ